MMRKFLKFLLRVSKKAPASDQSDSPYESDWLKWTPNNYPAIPEGFVKMTGASKISAAGTQFRMDDCLTVLSALKGGRVDQVAVQLVREPDNVVDTNAIRILVKLKHRDVHIGYVPRDVSDKIAQEFSEDMPLKAALLEWGKKKTGDAVFFRIALFVPSAKDRKKFTRQPEAT